MNGCWTDPKTKEGGISTELSDRINHTNSSSYLTYIFIWLMPSQSVYLLRYKSCFPSRFEVKGGHSLSHCFENWIFCHQAVKLNVSGGGVVVFLNHLKERVK